MSSKKVQCNYQSIVSQIEEMQEEINELRDSLTHLCELYKEATEECPDVIESEKAIVSSLEGICLNMLADEDPIGDA